MKRASLIEIRKMCKAAIDKSTALADDLSGNPNPQALVLKARAQGRKEAFEAIFEACHKDYFLLKTYSK